MFKFTAFDSWQSVETFADKHNFTWQRLLLQRFATKFGQRITLNVLEMDHEPGVTGKLEIYDGRTQHFPHLTTYDIINGTLPMGVTSSFNYMFVRFSWNVSRRQHCPSLPDCIKFTILVDSAPGILGWFVFTCC